MHSWQTNGRLDHAYQMYPKSPLRKDKINTQLTWVKIVINPTYQMNYEKCHNRNIMNIAVCGLLARYSWDHAPQTYTHTHAMVCVCVCVCMSMVHDPRNLKIKNNRQHTHLHIYMCVCVCVCLCVCVSVNLNQWFITRNTKGGHLLYC